MTIRAERPFEEEKKGVLEKVFGTNVKRDSMGEEYEEIKQHPTVGRTILAPLQLPKEALDIVLYHHERLDGHGYPEGLAGDQVPGYVAVVSVADAFDAMTAYRPYRTTPLTIPLAIEELRKHCGTQFVPEAVDALVRVLEHEHKWPAHPGRAGQGRSPGA